jgi:hypothetical protein
LVDVTTKIESLRPMTIRTTPPRSMAICGEEPSWTRTGGSWAVANDAMSKREKWFAIL